MRTLILNATAALRIAESCLADLGSASLTMHAHQTCVQHSKSPFPCERADFDATAPKKRKLVFFFGLPCLLNSRTGLLRCAQDLGPGCHAAGGRRRGPKYRIIVSKCKESITTAEISTREVESYTSEYHPPNS